MNKYRVSTLFDITNTGHVSNRMHTLERNQQRNWETLIQALGLRAQINVIAPPTVVNNRWQFDFEVEPDDVFAHNSDPVYHLKQDLDLIPMITGLGEQIAVDPVIRTSGPNTNIWFEYVSS